MCDIDYFLNSPTIWDRISNRNVSRKSVRGKEILIERENKKKEKPDKQQNNKRTETKYRCMTMSNITQHKNILINCTGEDIELIKMIGKGKSGKIYLANYKNKQIAIKIITYENCEPSYHNEYINLLISEIENSYTMEELELGPIVYDAFYIDKETQIDNFFGSFDTYNINCYILMELFTKSVTELYSDKLDIQDYQQIHKNMLSIINKQVYYKYYCLDVKPENFVVKKTNDKTNNKYTVKMIDYDWCISYTKFDMSIYKNEEILYTILLMQLCLTIYHRITKFHPLSIKVLKPFFEDKLFIKYTTNEYNKDLLKNALINAMKHEIYSLAHSYFRRFFNSTDPEEVVDKLFILFHKIQNSFTFTDKIWYILSRKKLKI
jgi:hypothetical protein